MFDKMKQLYEMQKKAREMQDALGAVKVEKSAAGGMARLVMNGNFQVESLSLDDSFCAPGRRAALEKMVSDLVTEAAGDLRRQVAAQAMGVMKGMDLRLPGM